MPPPDPLQLFSQAGPSQTRKAPKKGGLTTGRVRPADATLAAAAALPPRRADPEPSRALPELGGVAGLPWGSEGAELPMPTLMRKGRDRPPSFALGCSRPVLAKLAHFDTDSSEFAEERVRELKLGAKRSGDLVAPLPPPLPAPGHVTSGPTLATRPLPEIGLSPAQAAQGQAEAKAKAAAKAKAKAAPKPALSSPRVRVAAPSDEELLRRAPPSLNNHGKSLLFGATPAGRARPPLPALPPSLPQGAERAALLRPDDPLSMRLATLLTDHDRLQQRLVSRQRKM